MTPKATQKRYVVSNVGYGFAVHDTKQAKTYYDEIDPSGQSGPKGRIVDVFPTRRNAQAHANELNAAEDARGRKR